MLTVGDRFELLLDAYRRPDGSKWSGQKIEDATEGVVSRSYVSSLRKGHVSQPSYDKLYAISRVMGFPVELWSEEAFNRMFASKPALQDEAPTSERLERLFETTINPRTGVAYTNAEVAEISENLLSEEEVAGIRSGEIDNPTIKQALLLAGAFGVSPSYFTEKTPPLISQETLEGMSKDLPRKIIDRTLSLPESQQQFILSMIENIALLRNSNQLPKQ